MTLAGCGPLRAAAPGSGTTKTATQARAGAAASQPPLGPGQVGTLAQVPWGQIRAGWALAEYTTGSSQVAGPVTLYMLDPEGGMYRLYRWPTTTQPWFLLAWSGDKTRVLLQQLGTSQPTLHQLTLATGQITTFTLPSTVTQVLGYTRPDGKNILVAQNGIARYSLTGAFQVQLGPGGTQYATAVSSRDGLTEVVSGGTGVALVSNAGGMVRWLPVPGADAKAGGCMPVRWWNASDVLAACLPSQMSVPEEQLWLVPVSGAPPTALTPPRSGGSDFGDIDAWQLPTGLYLQALPGCGSPFIVKQAADGSLQAVTVPGSSGGDVVIATTTADSMLIRQPRECDPGSSLTWFNPATGVVQPVLTAQPNSTGVVAAVAYNPDGDQPPSH
jgi:TolB protein